LRPARPAQALQQAVSVSLLVPSKQASQAEQEWQA
jgi:hypothetical protein